MATVDLKQQLYELLSGAGSPAWSHPLACSAGPLTRISPGLRVAGGSAALKLPLQAGQAAAIKAAATDGGDGSVWVLPAAQLEVTNPRWEGEVVPEAVRRAKASLDLLQDTREPRSCMPVDGAALCTVYSAVYGQGLLLRSDRGTQPRCARVEARLSRLELHEAGSEVQPSARPPTSPDMFGELAILLPSAYQGGALRVLHGGREVQVDLAARNAKSSCFAAFYSGCRLGTLPLAAGHRCLLYYDLVWAGGSRPAQLPPEPTANLVQLSQQWGAAANALMRFCFMLENRYGETELRQRGIEALQGDDKVAAQMLLSACEQGAELDVCLALVKATARPQVDRYAIFEDQCEELGLCPCMACGGYHFDDTGLSEDAVWEDVDDILKHIVFENEAYGTEDEPLKLHWKHVKAAKFVPLAGTCPVDPMLRLSVDELLHNGDYFLDAPEQAMVHASQDSLNIMQWRRVGLLVCPRSMRLRNCIHANLARQTVHLHDMLGGQPESPGVILLRHIASGGGAGGGWLLDEQGAFADVEPDACDGFETFDPTINQGALPKSPWELAGAIASYLADPAARTAESKIGSLHALLDLATCPQLAAHRPPGDAQLVPSLLAVAAEVLDNDYTHPSTTDRLTVATIQLLRCYHWPSNALAALRSWVQPHNVAVMSGMTLLEACVADASSLSQPDSANAWAAASVLALSLAKGLRQGCEDGRRYRMSQVFKEAHQPLLLLQRVTTPAGSAALQVAVEAVLARIAGEPLTGGSYQPSFASLHASCVAILDALPPHVVAGCPALLKLVCSCAADMHAALEASKPAKPIDWSKQLNIAYTPVCERCQQLQEFVHKADQQTCTLPCTERLDLFVQVYLNGAMGRAAPQWRDLTAERVQLDGGADGWRFTKSHAAYARKVAEHAEQRQKLHALLDLLLPCLVLALPRGSSGGNSGGGSGEAVEGDARPAKAPRLA